MDAWYFQAIPDLVITMSQSIFVMPKKVSPSPALRRRISFPPLPLCSLQRCQQPHLHFRDHIQSPTDGRMCYRAPPNVHQPHGLFPQKGFPQECHRPYPHCGQHTPQDSLILHCTPRPPCRPERNPHCLKLLSHNWHEPQRTIPLPPQ
jgi:hypothetical protein